MWPEAVGWAGLGWGLLSKLSRETTAPLHLCSERTADEAVREDKASVSF